MQLLPMEMKIRLKAPLTDPKILSSLAEEDKGITLYECTSMSYYGTKYFVDSFVTLPYKVSEERQAIPIGQVKKLLCTKKEPYLYVQHFSATEDKNFDIFVVNPLSTFQCLPVKHLLDYQPLESYKIGPQKQRTISLRRHLLK